MEAKFDPLQYNYELVSKSDGVCHFQKIISKEPLVKDIIELSYWSKQDTWVIFIEAINLKQFLPPGLEIGESKIPLFVGDLKKDFDFGFIIKRVAKDPELLIQLGA